MNALELRLVDGGTTVVLTGNIGALTSLGGSSAPHRTRIDLYSGGHVFVKETVADIVLMAEIDIINPGRVNRD